MNVLLFPPAVLTVPVSLHGRSQCMRDLGSQAAARYRQATAKGRLPIVMLNRGPNLCMEVDAFVRVLAAQLLKVEDGVGVSSAKTHETSELFTTDARVFVFDDAEHLPAAVQRLLISNKSAIRPSLVVLVTTNDFPTCKQYWEDNFATQVGCALAWPMWGHRKMDHTHFIRDAVELLAIMLEMKRPRIDDSVCVLLGSDPKIRGTEHVAARLWQGLNVLKREGTNLLEAKHILQDALHALSSTRREPFKPITIIPPRPQRAASSDAIAN